MTSAATWPRGLHLDSEAATQGALTPVALGILAAVVAAVILLELRTGVASIRGGADHARADEPVMFWGIIAFHIGLLGMNVAYVVRPWGRR